VQCYISHSWCHDLVLSWLTVFDPSSFSVEIVKLGPATAGLIDIDFHSLFNLVTCPLPTPHGLMAMHSLLAPCWAHGWMAGSLLASWPCTCA
jgi:hypothetical protein